MKSLKYQVRYHLFYILIALVFPIVNGAETSEYIYHWGHPLPQGNIVYNFAFANNSTGWAVAGGGTILKTINGGESWDILMLTDSTSANIYDILLLESGILIASGDSGIIFRSEDEGETWQTQSYPTAGKLVDLVMIPGGSLSAAGENGSLLVSNDDGLNWMDVGPSGSGDARHHIWLSNTEAFVVGDQLFYHTQDGGNSWVEINENSGFGFNEVYFINENTGYVVDDFNYWETFDRGETWTQHLILSGPLYRFRTLVLDEQHWFAVCYGEGGEFWETTDGGVNWEQHFETTALGFPCLVKTPDNRLIFGSDMGDIFYTDDSGTTILNSTQNLALVSDAPIIVIGVRPDGVMFANNQPSSGSNNGTFFRSNDEGLTWHEQSSPIGLRWIFNIEFVNNQNGVLGAYDDLAYTTDGGDTWNASALPTDYKVTCFALPTTDAFFVTTYKTSGGGNLYKSVDGGASWEVVGGGLPAGSLQMTNITFSDENTGYISGFTSSQKKLYKTNDGGTTWNEVVFSGITDAISDMFWQSENVGLAAVANGNNGIFRTEDGGLNWTKVSEDEARTFTFLNNNRIAALYPGDSFFQESLDGGLSWTKKTTLFSSQYIGYPGYITAIAITTDGYLFGGEANRLLKATDETITGFQYDEVAGSIANNVEILSIAPNPMKSHGSIKYAISEAGLVEISIFGINGMKIKTIIREKMQAGIHEQSFNLSDEEIGGSSTCFISIVTVQGFDSEKIIRVK